MPRKEKPHADQRLRFVTEYLKDFNATQAAIRAGYSKRSAHVTASRILADPEISERIAAIQKRAAESAAITVERTQREIARIAYGDRRKLFEDDGTLKKISEIDDDTAALLAGIESDEIYRGRGEERALVGVLRKVKTFDKGRALEQCMSILGMHKTRTPGEDSALNLTIRLSSDRGRR